MAKYGHREDDTATNANHGGVHRARCADWCSVYTCSQTECLDCGIEHGCEGREPPSPPKPPPLPHLPPVTFEGREASDYFTYGATIHTNAWADAEAIRIRGASWFGMETKACVIGGAEHLPIETIAEWLKEHGFNAIRLPLAADAILSPGHPCMSKGDTTGVRNHNTALGSLTYLDQIAEIVHVAGESGLLVLLDMHVLAAGRWPDGGVVSDGGPRQRLMDAWDRLADLLCDANDYWNVFGADLKNEPYGMVWGGDGGASWDRLARELGRHVHNRCSRWLVFVEGVGHCADSNPGGAECQHPSAGPNQDMHLHAGTWWGENLQAAGSLPVSVSDDQGALGKVVYSPHTYGPSTHAQQQFDSSSFPRNMPHIWDTQFGYLARDGIAPVVIGEFGGLCDGRDAALQRALVSYMGQRNIGGFWWALNPESADTGGLIRSWVEGGIMLPEITKLNILATLQASHVPRSRERGASAVPAAAVQSGAASAQQASTSPPPPRPHPPLSSPVPPPPRFTPPPPYSVAVRTVLSPCGPPFAYVFGSYPPFPPVPSPPPGHHGVRVGGWQTTTGALARVVAVEPTSGRMEGEDGSGFAWLGPGLVLSFLVIGAFLMRRGKPRSSDGDEPSATPAPAAKRARRKKTSMDKGASRSRKRWQHVPSDIELGDDDAGADVAVDAGGEPMDGPFAGSAEKGRAGLSDAAKSVAKLDDVCARLSSSSANGSTTRSTREETSHRQSLGASGARAINWD